MATQNSETGTGKPKKKVRVNLFSFAQNNRARQNVNRWKKKGRDRVSVPLRNAQRLRSIHNDEGKFGQNVADVLYESRLRRYIRLEFSLLAVCLFAVIMSGIAAIDLPIYFIGTILGGWSATVVWRGYRHHVKCYWYLICLHADKCPHCGKPLVPSAA
jgi:hypothetical protein